PRLVAAPAHRPRALRLTDVALGLFERGSCGDAAREIGHVSRPVGGCLLVNHRVPSHSSLISAFLKIDFSVPIGSSWFDSNNRTTSRTFIFLDQFPTCRLGGQVDAGQIIR